MVLIHISSGLPESVTSISITFITIACLLAYRFIVISPKFNVLLVSSFGNGIPVELIDSQGDRTYTIAQRIDDDVMEASVHFFHRVGHVILRSDGTVDPASKSVYVLFWLPLRKKDRMQHMLSTDLPDFARLEDLGPEERRERMIDLAKTYKLGV